MATEQLTCEYIVRRLKTVGDTGTLVVEGKPLVESKRRRTAREGKCGKPARNVAFAGDLTVVIAILCDEHISASNPGGRFSVREVGKQPPLIVGV